MIKSLTLMASTFKSGTQIVLGKARRCFGVAACHEKEEFVFTPT